MHQSARNGDLLLHPSGELSQRRPRKSFIASRSKIASMRCAGGSSVRAAAKYSTISCAETPIEAVAVERTPRRSALSGVLLHVVARNDGGALGRSQIVAGCVRCGFPRPLAPNNPKISLAHRKLTRRSADFPGSVRTSHQPCASIIGSSRLCGQWERALRSVALALASRSPRCFGGRVARRRLGARQNIVAEPGKELHVQVLG